MNLPDLLAPMAVAFAISGLFLLFSLLLAFWKPKPAQRIAAWLAPSVAWLSGSLLVRGFPRFPPADSAGWLWWALAAAAISGLFFPRVPRLKKIVSPAVVAALSYLLLQPLTGHLWNPLESLLWISVATLIWLVGWFLIDRTRHAPRSWQPLLILTTAAIVLAILLVLAGTASYALYSLTLAGAIAPFLLLPSAFCIRSSFFPSSAVIAIPWTGLLLAGQFYANLPLAAALLTLLSLLSLAFPQFPKLRTLSPTRLFPLQLLWLILFLTLAILQTAQANPPL